MAKVRTLHGDIEATDLGVTSSHDHIFCIPPYWKSKGETDLLLDDPGASLQELVDFKAAGVTTVYDATAPDYGRQIETVAKLGAQAGLQIIGTTGFNKGFLWTSQKPNTTQTFQEYVESNSIAKLTENVIAEVEEGIEGTTHRAGVVKCGTGYNQIHPLERKTMEVIANASMETGAPLHSHTEMGTMLLEQIAIFKQLGMDMSRVGFAHLDRNPDPWLLKQAGKSGAFLGFDGANRIKYFPEHIRSEALITLVKAGFKEQILIGGDFARKSMSAHYGLGGLGMANLLTHWAPRFIEEANDAGLDGEALIHQFFVLNPQRYFAMKE